MHKEQRIFCKAMRKRFPQKFKGVDVLDIGSLDINGNNRYLFKGGTYHGIDVGEGKNVDQVISGHEYHPSRHYSFVISTECLEHNKYWRETIINAAHLTAPGGCLLITCASDGRAPHGVSYDHPDCAPFTNDYYRNISCFEFGQALPQPWQWDFFLLDYNRKTSDLYFFGVKHALNSREIYQALQNHHR